MRVEFETPDHAKIIELLLEGFIKAGELLIRAGAAPWRPPLQLVLQDDDVARWQLPTETQEKLTGDCEDLVIWWAAGQRATGRDPHARARIKTTGPLQTHCLLVTNGKIVDIYQQHLAAQRKYAAEHPEEFQLGGLLSFVKSVGRGIGHAAESVGHGVATAGRAVGRAAVATEHGIVKGAQYVAKDLPKDILHEAGSGLKSVAGGVADFAHDVGSAGSAVVNSLGDVVAGGAQDALHQVGKLVGGVGNSLGGGFGDDARSYNGGSGDAGAQDAMPPEMPPDGGGAMPPDAGMPYDGDENPWAGMGEADGISEGGDDQYDDEGGGEEADDQDYEEEE
jgi:hypothetical protein